MSADVAIQVESLSKRFRLGAVRSESFGEALTKALRFRIGRTPIDGEREELWALRDVQFEVPRGQVVGVIGRNGAGKSTLLKILSRITRPTHGRVVLSGRVGSLLEVGTGFHPELTGRENVFLNGAILGMRRTEVRARFEEIVAFSGVERFLDTPVKRYSTGMRVRLAFAVAAHLEPDILLIDEVLAVGDAEFQRRCLGKMGEVARGGRTVLFVSHNMAAVGNLCERGILLKGGRLIADGAVELVIREYLADSESIAANLEGQGDRVELHAVTLADRSGHSIDRAVCGDAVSISLELQCKRPIESAVVQIALNDGLGARVAVLNSEIAGAELRLPARRCTVRCRLPDLPLAPGAYDVEVKVISRGETLFFHPRAWTLEIEAGDFYETGRMPPSGWAGRCLLRQTWQLDDVEDLAT